MELSDPKKKSLDPNLQTQLNPDPIRIRSPKHWNVDRLATLHTRVEDTGGVGGGGAEP
jgi:hypothetical protein